jgi:hypothetical protein
LQHVFGVFPVLRYVLRQAKDLAFVPPDQLREGFVIAFTSLCDKNPLLDSGLA